MVLQIRPLAPEELAVVERHIAFDWGAPGKHRERLARQGRGEAVYLIAWDGGTPVGHVLIVWGGTTDEPMRSRVADCADIQDLFVAPEYRLRGVGSRLLEEAEALVTQLNQSQGGNYMDSGIKTGLRVSEEFLGGFSFMYFSPWC